MKRFLIVGTESFEWPSARSQPGPIDQPHPGRTSGWLLCNAKQVTFAYNGLGQKTNVTRYQITTAANLVVSTDYAYDTGNRLSGITHKQGATTLNSYTMGYDLLSRITSITSTADGASTYQGEAFSYDANGNRNGANYTVGSDNRTTTAPGYVSIGRVATPRWRWHLSVWHVPESSKGVLLSVPVTTSLAIATLMCKT